MPEVGRLRAWLLDGLPLEQVWLGRLFLGDPERRYNQTKRAYDLFAQISPVSAHELRMEILLPGSKQEYSQDKLVNVDPTYENDPLVREIIRPHRYMSAAAVALADPWNSKGATHLEIAEAHCKELERYAPDESAPRLNSDILRLDALVMRYSVTRRGRRPEGKTLQERIEKARKSGIVTNQKADEWMANYHACLVVAEGNGRECAQHIEELVKRLRKLVADIGKVPDFLTVDPIYRMAIDIEIPDQMQDVIAELSSKQSMPLNGKNRCDHPASNNRSSEHRQKKGI